MIKIFETGDLHIGRKFDRYPDKREALIESRFICLERMIKEAEERACSIFVVTGDMFNNVSTMKGSYVKRVVEILAKFSGDVLVLPGNHDYYTEEAKVWKDFKGALDKVDHNITLLNQFKITKIEVGDEIVNIYPAYCHSKHSADNNLNWIKEEHIDPIAYNIGIAHGAIQGITPDTDGKYYLMAETELSEIPMDVWLIGHTHTSYPVKKPETDKVYRGYRIYNAGTPEQLDLNNDTQGVGFIISISKDNGHTDIIAEAYHSGRVAYHDENISVNPGENALRNAIKAKVAGLGENDIVRLTIKGAVGPEEYENRSNLYKELLGTLMTYEVRDSDLCEQITKEKIYAEFPEIGFAATVLERLLDNPTEVQMAYDLLKECRK